MHSGNGNKVTCITRENPVFDLCDDGRDLDCIDADTQDPELRFSWIMAFRGWHGLVNHCLGSVMRQCVGFDWQTQTDSKCRERRERPLVALSCAERVGKFPSGLDSF